MTLTTDQASDTRNQPTVSSAHRRFAGDDGNEGAVSVLPSLEAGLEAADF